MITRIEALRFRCLRHLAENVGPCELFVGPNGSGKSTLLDAVLFVRDVLHVGPSAAVTGDSRLGVERRATDPLDLCWMREGDRFEIAVELEVPREASANPREGSFPRARYEIAIDGGDRNREPGLVGEALWLAPPFHPDELEPEPGDQLDFLSALEPWAPPPTILHGPSTRTPAGWRKVIGKTGPTGNDSYRSETSDWSYHFRIGPSRAALAILPEDETRFPIAAWVKRALMDRIHRMVLDIPAMRRPSPPAAPRAFVPDGSNLPWVVDRLARCHPQRMERWVERVRAAVPGVRSIESEEREQDRSRHLILTRANGLRVPSWCMSEGMLRLLAFTLLPELPELQGVLAIENPDAGLDATSLAAVYRALREIPHAQTLCSTSASSMAALAPEGGVIWFALDGHGATVTTRNPAPEPTS